MAHPYTYVSLKDRELEQWAPVARSVLRDTDSLFLHALRPYWEHYLPLVSWIELADRADLDVETDGFTHAVLEERRSNGTLIFRGAANVDRLETLRGLADHSVALLASKSTAAEVSRRARSLYGRGRLRAVVLPDRISRLEVEPAWRLIKRDLLAEPPKLVLLSLGWEKVVYASRLLDTFGCSVFDIGAAMTFTSPASDERTALARLVHRVLWRHEGHLQEG